MSSARERHARITDGYDSGAAAYARRGEASRREWFKEPQRRFRALLEAGGRVLDVGCASGLEMTDLQALGLDPVGMDVSREHLRIARDRLPSAGLARGTALALPFPTGAFQGVWASASLLHLARAEAPGALAEIRRVLADGGAFYASVQRGSGEGWVRGAVGTDLWYAFYEEDEWRDLVTAAGFSILWFYASDEGETQEGATGWINCLAVTS
ncbi:MAG: class I SAM-dependent methyltransferase [Chloroflexi bacterium]|nr:class I SAM-dependent methyltransferase [Chloroflexota bacterium]